MDGISDGWVDVDDTNDIANNFILKMRDQEVIMSISIENNKLKLKMTNIVLESISTINKELKVKYNSIKSSDRLATLPIGRAF